MPGIAGQIVAVGNQRKGGIILLVLFVVDRLFVLNGAVYGIKKRTHCVRLCAEKWITVVL